MFTYKVVILIVCIHGQVAEVIPKVQQGDFGLLNILNNQLLHQTPWEQHNPKQYCLDVLQCANRNYF